MDDEKFKLMLKLREETSFGLMDCKKALIASDWDIIKARAWLVEYRKKPGIFFD